MTNPVQISVINSHIFRALKICSNETPWNTEINLREEIAMSAEHLKWLEKK